jgi:hypothetical protein
MHNVNTEWHTMHSHMPHSLARWAGASASHANYLLANLLHQHGQGRIDQHHQRLRNKWCRNRYRCPYNRIRCNRSQSRSHHCCVEGSGLLLRPDSMCC